MEAEKERARANMARNRWILQRLRDMYTHQDRQQTKDV